MSSQSSNYINNGHHQYPLLEVLSHVEKYTNATNDANVEFKSCQWQLTKSRRKGHVMMSVETSFTAESLREDWRARHRLLNETQDKHTTGIGELIDEKEEGRKDDKKSSKSVTETTTDAPKWKLHDILEEKENTAHTNQSAAAPSMTDSTADNVVGLRQRKQNRNTELKENHDFKEEKNTSQWTLIQEENDDDYEDEEMLLLRRDPIEFFSGMPPRDLKLAQEKARQALQGYIDAANQAAKILAIINGR